jgi:hypothetical protein
MLLANMSMRPNIPDDVKLKLWALSGARCEFPNCNKYVWRDGLTLQEDNFAHMAHIVAASPKGPRGDETRSPELAMDFDNLMLLCLDHSKLVDGKNKSTYTIEQLQKNKKEHEERIRRQTDTHPEMITSILRFAANIGDRPVSVSITQARQAILPRYPLDDHGISLDFTNLGGRGDESFWKSFAQEITKGVNRGLEAGNDHPRPTHVSIFALGPIPLLAHLGHALGNTISADIYQRHRDTEDWKWKAENEETFEYITNEYKSDDSNEVAVVLSLSGKIHPEEVYKKFEQTPYLYEITIDSPGTSFLTQNSRLEKFRVSYRELLSRIRERHGGEVTIHLFPAIPAPIAVLCGRELLPKSDPKMLIYDNEKDAGGFVPILTIN